MSVSLSADRACHVSMLLGMLIAIVAFVVVGSDVLLDQWITGYASREFILGTAALIAGICLGLFAIIALLGLLIAAALGSKTIPQEPSPKDEG